LTEQRLNRELELGSNVVPKKTEWQAALEKCERLERQAREMEEDALREE
jgi:hypothetical protein